MKLASWNPRIDWNKPTKCEECGSMKFCRPLVDKWGEVVACYDCKS